MLLNKTVYLEGGGVEICQYDPDKLNLSGLWIFIFVVSLILNAFALIGNTIVTIACFAQKTRPVLIIYIHALAISDLLYAIVAPLYTYRYVLQHWPKLVINFGLAGRLSHHLTLIGNTFSSISSWLVVALTIDRMILTKYPFKASYLSTPKRAYLVIALITVLCFAFNAVWMYEFFEVPITVGACNGYWSIPQKVVKPDNSTYIPIRYRSAYQVYAIVSAVLTMYALPAFIMIVCNVFILSTLMKGRFSGSNAQTADGRRTSRKKMAEVRLTKMIVIVSIIFLVCNMPDIVTRLLWKFVDPLIVANIQPIAHLFLMVNVGANFVIYALFNKHLFDTLLMWVNRYCCCKGGMSRPDNTHTSLPSHSSEGSKPTVDSSNP